MKTIDIHHHAFPKGSKAKKWDIITDKKEMKEINVSQSILSCPLPLNYEQCIEMNNYLYETTKDIENYYFMASIPFGNEAIQEINRTLKLGAVGFSLTSHNDSVYIGDEKNLPVFERLNELEAVILLHPNHFRPEGSSVRLSVNDSVYEYTFDTTRAIMDYVYRGRNLQFPKIKWILSHGGGNVPYLAHRLSIAGEWNAINWTEEEIMNQLKGFYYDLALSNDDLNYQFLKDFAGTDHLLFGLDYPNHPIDGCKKAIMHFDKTNVFTKEEKEKILYGNAKRIFHL